MTAVDGKTALPIGGLTDGQTYAVIRVDDYSIQLKHSVKFDNGRDADQERTAAT